MSEMQMPSSQPPVWVEQVRIGSYDVDASGRATAITLCRYFLDAAWNHAEMLGFGFQHLRSQGRLWVLSRLLLEVQQAPAWGSRLRLRTWPRGIQSVFAMREFEIEDSQGERLAAGSSAWVVLDAVSKRPLRLHKLLPSLAELDGQAALGRDPAKLAAGETWERSFATAVRYTDIDVNRHVNSSRYIGWMLDAYPPGFHQAHALRSLEINYLGETHEGEELSIRTQPLAPLRYGHWLIKANGDEVCRGCLAWSEAAQAAT